MTGLDAGVVAAPGRDHAPALVVGGLAVCVTLLAWLVWRAVRSGRPDGWLARLSFLVGFAWSGEAMWEVATQKLRLSPVFAGFGFFLFEAMMATAMIRAERAHAERGRAGRHGRAVWLIAVVAGLIAAMAGDSAVEMGLRLAVPLLVAHQWWVGLAGDGVARPADAISWTWTPRRVLVAVGLARPGVTDLSTVDRERQVRAVAKVAHRLHSTSWRWRWRRGWCQMRLRSLAMRADDAVLDAARARVERVWRAAERTRPATPAELEAVASARADAEAARAEAERARSETELALAEAARSREDADHARAEAVRVCAEAEAARVEAHRAGAEALAVAQAEAEALAAEAEHARAEATGTKADLDTVRAELASRRRSSTAGSRVPVSDDGDSVPRVPRVGSATVRAVLDARQAEPSATQKEIAARVQVSDRTVRAVLAAVGNGRGPDSGSSAA
ncbi:hypothetical protein GCM10009558_050200 [Virgisporangium aurantiacum]